MGLNAVHWQEVLKQVLKSKLAMPSSSKPLLRLTFLQTEGLLYDHQFFLSVLVLEEVLLDDLPLDASEVVLIESVVDQVLTSATHCSIESAVKVELWVIFADVEDFQMQQNDALRTSGK